MITAKTLTAEEVRRLCRAAIDQIERVQSKKCPLLDTAEIVSVRSNRKSKNKSSEIH